jgi:hypothetical protein
MGWKETTAQQVTGPDNGPIEVKDVSAIDVIRARIASASARLGAKRLLVDAKLIGDFGLCDAKGSTLDEGALIGSRLIIGGHFPLRPLAERHGRSCGVAPVHTRGWHADQNIGEA